MRPAQRAGETPLYPWHTPQDHAAVSAQPQSRVAPLSSYAAESERRLDRTSRVHTPANAERSAVEEIRASLQEFREAVDDLRESRRRF